MLRPWWLGSPPGQSKVDRAVYLKIREEGMRQ